MNHSVYDLFWLAVQAWASIKMSYVNNAKL